MSPEHLAASARHLLGELLEALALSSDEIADDLGARMGMVAWEREEQIGAAQQQLQALSERRFDEIGGQPVRIRELREQPLEALALAWQALQRGHRVHVESEAGACPAVFRLLRDVGELLGGQALATSTPGQLDHPNAAWTQIGVSPRRERVALVQADADHELAAYLLARACLRRTGFDPRVVHRVIVEGSSERLERTLRRLWIGARMGPVDDDQAFSGPVTAARAEKFLAAEALWRAREGVTTICPGGALIRSDAPEERFLAPALFRLAPLDSSTDASTDADLDASADTPTLGPMLLIQPVQGEAITARAEALLAHLAPPGHGRVRFGAPRRDVPRRRDDRQLHGALLVERLPPGLPEPRP
ncbi:hypothetical protein G6O69_03525 [Pseudenhygromyxa sp. WMMC2535]|uniref:hypothetical protein n=1 Tax=Pseudenhygromyxa sp. WMMC2535 TaxID=2712867 RepID=UPI0015566D1C|nr:hypothetical protein [Pseudenhygromyxa sp. WMMC2535]NVB36885.1 hypothetical protein [Pseudenhygromyxa sp. WMMC2535]